MWMSMGVHPGPQGSPQMLGGDTVTLQKLERKVSPPQRGVYFFGAQRPQKKVTFYKPCQQEAGAPPSTPMPSSALGQPWANSATSPCPRYPSRAAPWTP